MTWRQGSMVAVKIGIGPTIMLQSGAWFDFCAPAASDFTINDIAHGLANICRYSGQCSRIYSVAEHSILVSEMAVGFEFKHCCTMPQRRSLAISTRRLSRCSQNTSELRLLSNVPSLIDFGVVGVFPPQVKKADLRVLAAEQRQIMPEGTDGWVRGQKVDPAPIVVRHLPPDEAKRIFLERFDALRPAYALRKRIIAEQ